MDSEYNKMRRVLSLYDRLSSGKIIYLKDEINTTGVSDRSFKRDITEIRNYLAEKSVDGEIRKEVVYDRNRNCYYMTEKEDTLSDYQKIFAIAKILLGSKGLSCVEMNQVMEYLLSFCGDESKRKEIKKYLANEAINYQGPNHGKNLLNILWEVAQAAEYERKVKILYQRLEKHKKVERILKPLQDTFHADEKKEVQLFGMEKELHRRSELDHLIEKLTKEKTTIDQKIKLQMGSAVSAVAPDYRISWSQTSVNRLDTNKLKAEKPDIYETYLKKSSSRRFQVKYEPAA